ncbi:MAG TPA: hypothetical protein VGQ36_25405 [Thermoanaerobaculia bacterium]|jgi:hypothetical protein|nr:hypothetical protein [Thermoanaerobaculia bacterium]
MRSLGALALLSILVATPAAASCQDAAGNLLAGINCGFDKDAKGWTASPGAVVSRDAADHGVLKAVADSQGSLTILGPCVAARPNVEYHIGARLRGVAGTSYFCSVNVFQYSDAACTEGQDPLGSAAAPPDADWAKLDGSATTSDAAKSLEVRPVCSGKPGFTVQFDDFVVSKN